MRWPLLDALSEEDRRELLASAATRRYGRGDVIFHEGDHGDCLHLIEAGHVGLQIHTTSGEVATVRVLSPGEFFGELALVSPGPRSATARCVDDVRTVIIRNEQLEHLRHSSPRAESVLLSALAIEIRRLAALLVEAMYSPADQRVWNRLHELAGTFGDGDGSTSVIPLNQTDLAQVAGCARPTLNRILQLGEADGILAIRRGRIEILDAAALAARAHRDPSAPTSLSR